MPISHSAVIAPTTAARARLLDTLDLPVVLAEVDAHRRLRGPYSAAGALLRRIVPEALRRSPDLVARHDVEILTVAPELRGSIVSTRETLTSLAAPEERTRFYPGARTLRVAHGVTEFLIEYVSTQAPRAVLIDHVDQADATDVEWLAVLLRRADPSSLRIVVGAATDTFPGDLEAAVSRYARRIGDARGGGGPGDSGGPGGHGADAGAGPAATDDHDDSHALAVRYVASDGSSDDPRLLAAYEGLDPRTRSTLHDARAAELEARDEPSLRLGAIPYHREHGHDPRGAGVRALRDALEHCVLMGFYDAVLDLGRRSHALLDWRADPEACWLVTAKVCTALTALGRPDEAAAEYDAACAATTLPSVHLQSAYGRAMLYTRFYEPARRDHLQAKAWINTAIAISLLLSDEERRAFNVTFNENGLALIEMHLGDLREALRLVTAGLDRLDAEIGPDQQTLHRSVLRYNRAQLLAVLGPPTAALAEYDLLIAADPNHSEYYMERAELHRRMGDAESAFADYSTAIQLSPPYPEPHYNRGDLALDCGDVEQALADFDYVLELAPEFIDAYVNRGGIRFELGDFEGAAADVAAGLALSPDHAHLHCLRGLLAQEAGSSAEARSAFGVALGLDSSLVAAWSARAALAFESGDLEPAIDDLTRALDLVDDPDIRANRALALRCAGRIAEAIADCTAALSDPGASRLALLRERGRCYLELGDHEAARADLQACIATGPPELAAEARDELSALLQPS